MSFLDLKQKLQTQFKKLSSDTLLYTDTNTETLWTTYLESFPEIVNPILRTRREHDCSTCRHFIKTLGNVVTADSKGKIHTLWDFTMDDPHYQVVVDAMRKLVTAGNIENVFLSKFQKIGVDKNFEQLLTGEVATYNHFFVTLPTKVVSTKIGETKSEKLGDFQVLYRGLTEITENACDVVLDLIADNALYRGAESKGVVEEFKKIKKTFNSIPVKQHKNFAWHVVATTSAAITRIRNTALGTLLLDISNDADLDEAVRKFEAIMAPANYRRPTAIVTKSMVEKAKKEIESLGLTSALQRRHAVVSDINVNDVLFVDRSINPISEDIFGNLGISTKTKSSAKIEEIPIDKFLIEVLPTAKELEILVENKHKNNFVSLIAPQDPTAPNLFKWNNGFSWSYVGEVADGIKEKVKAAGGNVTGEFRCSLAWYNYDDLDLHMEENGTYEICYRNKGYASPSGGMLDVDMNAGSGKTRVPVENIVYPTISKMKPGVYALYVNQFSQREKSNTGFEVDIEILGERFTYSQETEARGKTKIAEFELKNGVLKLITPLTSNTKSANIWNVQTEMFQKVLAVTNSPNFWGESGVGNKHYFFFIKDCKNSDSARGFYNEFLSADLNKHRKVLELIGGKLKPQKMDNELSGLGFSSTQKNTLTFRVHGNYTRTIKVIL